MKRISTMDLIIDDNKTFHCQDITDVVETKEVDMVEVTIKCTITREAYNKLMEEI